MIWNCPHCSTVISLGIDIEQVKRAYVRCAACRGVALISKKVYADADAKPPGHSALDDTGERTAPPPMNASTTEKAIKSTPEMLTNGAVKKAEPPKTAKAPQPIPLNSLTIEDALNEFNLDLSPPPFPNTAPLEKKTDPTLTIPNLDLSRSVAIPTEGLDLMMPPAGPLGFGMQSQSAPKKKETPAPSNSELPAQTPAKLSSVPSPPKSAPKPSTSAVHQFEFRESSSRAPAAENSRIYQFPRPPEFLTRHEETVSGVFQSANDQAPTKKNQKPLSIAVAIAAVIAILSGIYLFIQGQQLLQESRRSEKKVIRFSQQEATGVAGAAKAPASRPPKYKAENQRE